MQMANILLNIYEKKHYKTDHLGNDKSLFIDVEQGINNPEIKSLHWCSHLPLVTRLIFQKKLILLSEKRCPLIQNNVKCFSPFTKIYQFSIFNVFFRQFIEFNRKLNGYARMHFTSLRYFTLYYKHSRAKPENNFKFHKLKNISLTFSLNW